jgi:hypothetical protein
VLGGDAGTIKFSRDAGTIKFSEDVGPIEISEDAGKMEGIILTSSTTMWSPFPSGEGLIMLRMIKNQGDNVRCSAETSAQQRLVRTLVRSFAKEAQDDKKSG